MAVYTISQGEKVTASILNTYAMNAGLVFVKQVTVGSAVATVDVTSCFSAEYDNYLVSYSGIASTNSAIGLTAYLLSGTTPTANGWYGNTYYVVTAGAGALTNNPLSNTAYCEVGGLRSGDINSGTFEVNAPFRANYTRTTFMCATSDYWRIGAYSHNASTSYNGIRVAPTAGTITGGTVTVYGRRIQ